MTFEAGFARLAQAIENQARAIDAMTDAHEEGLKGIRDQLLNISNSIDEHEAF